MPTWVFTSPDGRKLRVTGARVPDQNTLEQLFAQAFPEDSQPSQFSVGAPPEVPRLFPSEPATEPAMAPAADTGTFSVGAPPEVPTEGVLKPTGIERAIEKQFGLETPKIEPPETKGMSVGAPPEVPGLPQPENAPFVALPKLEIKPETPVLGTAEKLALLSNPVFQVGAGIEKMLGNDTLAKLTQLDAKDPVLGAVTRAAVNNALGLVEFVESPLGLGALVAGAVMPIPTALVFAGVMATDLADYAADTIENWEQMTPAQKAEAIVNLAASGALTALAGKVAIQRTAGPLGKPTLLRKSQSAAQMPPNQQVPLPPAMAPVTGQTAPTQTILPGTPTRPLTGGPRYATEERPITQNRQPEHPGVPQRPNVPENVEEIRQGPGGPPSGGGGAEGGPPIRLQPPEVQEPPPETPPSATEQVVPKVEPRALETPQNAPPTPTQLPSPSDFYAARARDVENYWISRAGAYVPTRSGILPGGRSGKAIGGTFKEINERQAQRKAMRAAELARLAEEGKLTTEQAAEINRMWKRLPIEMRKPLTQPEPPAERAEPQPESLGQTVPPPSPPFTPASTPEQPAPPSEQPSGPAKVAPAPAEAPRESTEQISPPSPAISAQAATPKESVQSEKQPDFQRTTPAPKTPEREKLEARYDDYISKLSDLSKKAEAQEKKLRESAGDQASYQKAQRALQKIQDQIATLKKQNEFLKAELEKALSEDRLESRNPILRAREQARLGDTEAYERAKREWMAEAQRQGLPPDEAERMFLDEWAYPISEDLGLSELVKRRTEMAFASERARRFSEEVDAIPNLTPNEVRHAKVFGDNNKYSPDKLSAELDRLKQISRLRAEEAGRQRAVVEENRRQENIALAERILATEPSNWEDFVQNETGGEFFTTKKHAQERIAALQAQSPGEYKVYRFENGKRWKPWYTREHAIERARRIIEAEKSRQSQTPSPVAQQSTLKPQAIAGGGGAAAGGGPSSQALGIVPKNWSVIRDLLDPDWWKYWWTSGRGVPVDVHRRKVIWEGTKAALGRTEYILRDLANALRKELNISHLQWTAEGWGSVPKRLLDDIQEVLEGKQPAMILPQRIRPIVLRMRNQIDSLTQRAMQYVDPQLRAILGSHLGEYLTRSYRIFDDPMWLKKIEPQDFDTAVTWLMREHGISRPQAETILREMLADWADIKTSLLRGRKLGSKDLTMFMKRGDIAPEIRKVMGEYRDPVVNYVRTISKLAKFVADHEFLRDVRQMGLGVFLFEPGQSPPGFEHEIAAPSSSVMAPLSGLRTSKLIKRALEEWDAEWQDPGVFLRFLYRLNAWSKGAKTVGSIMTSARNAVQLWFNILNGHYNFRDYKTAAKGVWNDIVGNDQAWQEYYNRATTYGLTDENVLSSQLRECIRDYSGRDWTNASPDEYAFWRILLAGPRAAVKQYRAWDALGKLYGWECEKKIQRDIHPDWTDQQVEAEAAWRVRMTYPTWSMVPNAIQLFRRLPVKGPFAAFWTESVRTMTHSLKYAIDDMRSANPKQQVYGAKRLIGWMAATFGIPLGLSYLGRTVYGLSMQTLDDIRKTLPEWERYASIVPLSSVKDGKVHFVNLSWSNPYSFFADALRVAFRGGEEKLWDRISQTVTTFASALYGEQMLWNAVKEASVGVTDEGRRIWDENDSPAEKAWKKLMHIEEALEFGTAVRSRKKIIPAWKHGGQLDYGRRVSAIGETIAEFTGVRIETADFKSYLGYAMRDYAATSRKVAEEFGAKIGKTASVSNEELVKEWVDSEQKRFEEWKKLRDAIQTAMRNGVSDNEVKLIARKAGIDNADVNSAISGKFVPRQPGGRRGGQKAQRYGRQWPVEEMRRAVEALNLNEVSTPPLTAPPAKNVRENK